MGLSQTLNHFLHLYPRAFDYVLLGAHSKRKFTGTEKYVTIKKWITHPNAQDFTSKMPYGQLVINVLHWDYSLLLLDQSVNYTKSIQPIALPAMPDQDYTNKQLWTSGWGNTRVSKGVEFDGIEKLMMSRSSDVPKKVPVKGVAHDAEVCNNQGYQYLCRHCEYEAILCTYGINHFNQTIVEDACTGDSGGIFFF